MVDGVTALMTSSVLDLRHGGHGHVLDSSDRRSRRAGGDTLGRLDAEEGVEERQAELATTREVHEEVEGVVSVVEEDHHHVEEPSCRLLLGRDVQKRAVSVSEEIDVDWHAEHNEHDADDYQHHCR